MSGLPSLLVQSIPSTSTRCSQARLGASQITSTSSTNVHQLSRSSSQMHLAQPHDPIAFPCLVSGPDSKAPISSGASVPFPKLPRTRRLRGVGTQPWHHTGSSDSEDDTTPGSSSSSSPIHLAGLAITSPPPPRHTTARSTPTLKLDMSAMSRRTLSESQVADSDPLSSSATLIYRKNGTPVKSSLKSRSSSSIRSEGSTGQPSLPTTPSADKIVHFDAQLEQVKFFNKHHKPSVISRGGSPDDTEEDSEFLSGPDQQHKRASFYPGSSEEEKIRQLLVLEQVNIPLRNALAQPDEILGSNDVKMEKIGLSADAKMIEGAIIVRNIAFEKWIAVRFTFDWWQTTSEVTARYCESLPEYNIDRFQYSIRVPDVTNKIEEKRLFVAIRYTTAGREIWDNNNGENYQLRFKRVTASAPQKEKRHPPSWPVKSANVDQMADLRRELEKVVREGGDDQDTRAWESLTVKLRAQNMYLEEERSKEQPLSLRKRYDFHESSKIKWKAPEDLPKVNVPTPGAGIPFPSTAEHTRSQSDGLPTSPRLRGSPRESDFEPSPKFFIDPREGDPWHHQRSHSHSPGATRGRHHQRGYFDSWLGDATAQGLRLTPPTGPSTASTIPAPRSAPEEGISETESNSSITSTSSSSTSIAENVSPSFGMDRSTVRFNSYPMDRAHLSAPVASTSGALPQPSPPVWNVSPPASTVSFESTPSITSASTPSQSPSSPSEDVLDASSERRCGASTLESMDYNYFLSRFCYFTGNESQDNRSGALNSHRQSASDSNIYSSTSSSPLYARRHSMASNESWVGGQPAIQEDDFELSGTTTPTRSPRLQLCGSPGEKDRGMVTPRAGSPSLNGDVERTPRPSFDFARPFRGSL